MADSFELFDWVNTNTTLREYHALRVKTAQNRHFQGIKGAT